jgi:hypothetical protein
MALFNNSDDGDNSSPSKKAVLRVLDDLAYEKYLEKRAQREFNRNIKDGAEKYSEWSIGFKCHLRQDRIKRVTRFTPYVTSDRGYDKGMNQHSKLCDFYGSSFQSRVLWAQQAGLFPEE